MVLRERLELSRLAAQVPKTCVSTDSTIGALSGASTRTRTGTLLLARDFKSLVSTYSTMEAMADSVGFEPTRPFRAYSLSRGAPSTTRPTVLFFILLWNVAFYLTNQL